MFKFIKWVLVLMVVSITAFYFLATQSPAWVNSDQTDTLKKRMAQSINGGSLNSFIENNLSSLLSTGNISVSDKELSVLLYGALASDKQGQKLINASEDIQAKILPADNAIQVGALINTNNLVDLAETPEDAVKISKWLNRLPFMKDRNIYVALQAYPSVIDGKLAMDKNAKLLLGKVPLPLTSLAIFGLDTSGLRDILIEIPYTRINNISFDGEELKLSLRLKY